MQLYDTLGQRYSKLPSELVDKLRLFDLHCAVFGDIMEQEAQRRAESNAHKR